MADEHWFDARHRILTQAASRRGALSLLSALATLLAPGPGMSEAGRKKKRRNKKYKKKKWKKRKQRKLASCSGGICEIVFTKGPASDDCEEICQQCKQAGPEFCIHNPDGAHPDYYPT